MVVDEQIAQLAAIIQKSDLDQTIKDILIKDLHQDGLTDFLVEQIKTYCGNDSEVEKIINQGKE